MSQSRLTTGQNNGTINTVFFLGILENQHLKSILNGKKEILSIINLLRTESKSTEQNVKNTV